MHSYDITEQQTRPFAFAPATNEVHQYIAQHRLLWVQTAKAAAVPAITVWGMDHGLCVTQEHADRVRKALQRLTGVPFTGPILVLIDTPR
jgi:hypothetical protein